VQFDAKLVMKLDEKSISMLKFCEELN